MISCNRDKKKMLSLCRVKLKLRASEHQERCRGRCLYVGACLVLAFCFSLLVRNINIFIMVTAGVKTLLLFLYIAESMSFHKASCLPGLSNEREMMTGG